MAIGASCPLNGVAASSPTDVRARTAVGKTLNDEEAWVPAVPTDEVMEHAFAVRHGAGAFDGPDEPTGRSARDRRNAAAVRESANPSMFSPSGTIAGPPSPAVGPGPGNDIALDDIRAGLT